MDNQDKKSINPSQIEEMLQAKFSQKKNEIMSAGGGLSLAKESVKAHYEFLQTCKAELTEAVAEGKMQLELANYVLSWLERSHSKVKEMQSSMQTYYDVKTGEAVAIDSVLKSVKELSKKEDELPVLDLLGETPTELGEPLNETRSAAEEPQVDVAPAEPKVAKRTKPRAQEKSKKVDDTVQRLKKARSKKDPQ